MNNSSSQHGCVLVHGAHQGPWVWRRLIDALEIPAVTVSLPGRGQRDHHLSNVSLEDCVTAVVEAVAGSGFQRPVLVGHSMSGVVVDIAAERLGADLGAVVAVAASVPAPGRAQIDQLMPSLYAPVAKLALGLRPGGRFAPMSMSSRRAKRMLCNDLDSVITEDLVSRLQPETAHLLLDPSPKHTQRRRGRRIYVVATADKCISPKVQRRSAFAFGATEIVEISAGHEVMLGQPKVLASLIARVAKGWSASGRVDGSSDDAAPRG